jgi:type II secretory pathway pseudopilin PulG
MSLIESTLVILVLLVLVSVLFVTTRNWKKGADRTACLLSQYQVQQAVRGYSNLAGNRPGDEVPGLPFLLFGEGKYIERMPLCPTGGIYSYMGEQVPVLGDLYMKCSLASQGHAPADATGW